MDGTRGTNYYQLVNGPTWEAAQANAVALGGHLATISHPHETEYLVELYYNNGVVDSRISNSSR